MEKPKQSKYLEDLKRDLNKTSSVIDYFLTIGFNIKNLNNLKSYQECIKSPIPELLSKYPPIDKNCISIDESVIPVSF
jgi:hypothetical protein